LCDGAKLGAISYTFGDHISTERTIVTVTTPQRTFKQECDLQTGINSLLGLLMVNSGCSVLQPLRMLMNFHIPFCSTREMLRRVVGAYLTEQYYVQRSGGTPDWELNKLKELYTELSKLNQDFVRRIQGAIKKDAVSNAIFGFFASASLIASDLDALMENNKAYMLNSQPISRVS
jgi:hypothetical protein